jgi:hypothetical protein
MSNTNNSSLLVEITPIEYQAARIEFRRTTRTTTRHNPRVIRYRDFRLDYQLSKGKLEEIITKIRISRSVSISGDERYINYRYTGKPVVIIDRIAEKLLTTTEDLEKYGERACQQSCSILMRILQKHRYASFKRISVTVDQYRMGKTKEDREITFRAIEYLVGNVSN